MISFFDCINKMMCDIGSDNTCDIGSDNTCDVGSDNTCDIGSDNTCDVGPDNVDIPSNSIAATNWPKNNMKNVFEWTKYKLRQYISHNDRVNGFVLFLLHLILQIIVYFALITCPIHSTKFVGAVVLWVFILLSNVCFRGCILLKLERYLWNTKTWYGPMYLFCKDSYMTSNLANNFFICQQIIVVTIVFLRILFF